MPGSQLYNNGLGTVLAENIQITPAGSTVQGSLASLINGGTVVPTNGLLINFATITPAGSTAATATPITAITTVLETAASTTGAAFVTGNLSLGQPVLLLNQGTAAVHIYSDGTIDSTAGTTGVTLTNAHRCFFTAVDSTHIVSGPEGGVTS
jgi:hypothetical protein